MTTADLQAGDGLLVVDVQVDFCPGGALPVPDGDDVVPILNEWLAEAVSRGVPIYASRDWHPLHHPSFREEGGDWPPHCLQDSPGASFHPGLRLPQGAIVVSKGTRFDHDQLSAFHDTGLHERLQKDGVQRLWIGGLAQDVCVAASAVEAVQHGFDVSLIPGGSLPVFPETAAEALHRMLGAGVRITTSQ
jgi:nicotinamidase/pyrazinamidase